MRGSLPPEHLFKYKTSIAVKGYEPITFENISSQQTFDEVVSEAVVPVAMLMNNPFNQVDISSFDCEVQILPKNKLSKISSAKISNSRVSPGQTVDISVVLLSYLSEKKTYQLKLKVPDNLQPGKYEIIVAGAYEYERFLREVSPHKFTPQDLSSLIDALRNLLDIRRDRLYLAMRLQPGGITIQHSELPDLPQTKALLLQDSKRTLSTMPYQHRLTKSVPIDTIVTGRKNLKITVEE